MTPGRRALLLAFGLLGLGAASTSSYVHYRLLTEPSYTSFCDVSAAVSCTEAYLSPYGSIRGVPVALGGVLFFAVVLVLVGVAGRERSRARENVPGYVFALSVLSLAFVLYLAWGSYVRLGTFCMLCAITYIAVIAIFILSRGALILPMTTLPRRATADLRLLVKKPLPLLLLVLLAAGAVALVGVFPSESRMLAQESAYPPLTDQQRAELEKWWAAQPKVDVPIPNDTKVLVVKFSDYMCPACRQTYEWYKPVLGKYVVGGQVRYVVKHYPLEAECNPNAPSNHYASCEAAAAVIMARSKGTAQTLEQWFFSNQPSLTADTVKKAAREVGGIQDFDAQYAKVLGEIKADAGLGALLGVRGTPTFFINGRRLPGQTISAQSFDYLIELALKDPK